MEGGGGRLAVTLLYQMSAIDNGRSSLAGLTLDAVLVSEKRAQSGHASRTLLDIIRDEPPNFKDGHRDKKSWKTFRDKLRLKRAGAAWTSSVHIPASDVPVQNSNSHRFSRRGSFRSNSAGSGHEANHSEDFVETVPTSRPLFTRRASTRLGPAQHSSTQPDDSADISMPSDAPPDRIFRPQISRHNSTRFTVENAETSHLGDDDEPASREGTRRLGAALAEERVLSAREAVAAQEAAEAAAAAAAEEEAAETAEEPEPVRMSLMDLLEETDRQMGLVGSRYTMGDDEEEEEDEEEFDDGLEERGGIEYNCCVCMVRSKGSAFIPCGHTFCRLCSRELWVQRGNCPLCNGFILEILDIF